MKWFFMLAVLLVLISIGICARSVLRNDEDRKAHYQGWMILHPGHELTYEQFRALWWRDELPKDEQTQIRVVTVTNIVEIRKEVHVPIWTFPQPAMTDSMWRSPGRATPMTNYLPLGLASGITFNCEVRQ